MNRMSHVPPLALLNILQMLAPELWQPEDLQINLPPGLLPLFTLPSEARMRIFKDAEKPCFPLHVPQLSLDANMLGTETLRGSRVGRRDRQELRP